MELNEAIELVAQFRPLFGGDNLTALDLILDIAMASPRIKLFCAQCGYISVPLLPDMTGKCERCKAKWKFEETDNPPGYKMTMGRGDSGWQGKPV